MSQTELLICTDLDRTLIPNGPQSESANARPLFRQVVAQQGIRLAYVSGRDQQLVQKAIVNYQLPIPDYVIGDVGTSLFEVRGRDDWLAMPDWQLHIGKDWQGLTAYDLMPYLTDVAGIRLQPMAQQNLHKLSYFVPLYCEQEPINLAIEQRLEKLKVRARLVWSIDEPAGIGLLDILPYRASKFHAIIDLMQHLDMTDEQVVFCGDSGNDMEVLTSHLPSVLVANAAEDVRQQALAESKSNGTLDRIYLAQGNFLDMNGNYAAGMLEGISHYHSDLIKNISSEQLIS